MKLPARPVAVGVAPARIIIGQPLSVATTAAPRAFAVGRPADVIVAAPCHPARDCPLPPPAQPSFGGACRPDESNFQRRYRGYERDRAMMRCPEHDSDGNRSSRNRCSFAPSRDTRSWCADMSGPPLTVSLASHPCDLAIAATGVRPLPRKSTRSRSGDDRVRRQPPPRLPR